MTAAKHDRQKDVKVWVLRPGRSGTTKHCEAIEQQLQEESFVGLDDQFSIGDISDGNRTPAEMRAEVGDRFLELSAASVRSAVSNVVKLSDEIDIDDIVLSPSRVSSPRVIRIGIVKSRYHFECRSDLPHQRRVRWIGEVEKDRMSESVQRELGAARLLFQCKRNKGEVMQYINELKKG